VACNHDSDKTNQSGDIFIMNIKGFKVMKKSAHIDKLDATPS